MSRIKQLRHGNIGEIKRLPRLGKIRLGVKKKSAKNREYPSETDYFVCPPELLKKLGLPENAQPKSLDVMLPSEELTDVFPTRLAAYKAAGLYCEGDGDGTAYRRNDDDPSRWDQRTMCPCPMFENGECKRNGVLNIVVPDYSYGGIWSIVTGSFNIIVDIPNMIDFIRKLVGYTSWIPLRLERVPQEVSHVDKETKKVSRTVHYPMRLTAPYDTDFVNRIKQRKNLILDGPTYVLPPVDSPRAITGPGPTMAEEEIEVFDAEIVPKDGDDKRPEKGAPQPQKQGSDPTPEADSPPPNPVVRPQQVDALWNACVAAFAQETDPAMGEAKASTFFKWFINEYADVKSSNDLTLAVYEKNFPAIKKIAGKKDEGDRLNAMEQFRDELVNDLVAQSEADAAQSEAKAEPAAEPKAEPETNASGDEEF